MKTVQLSNFDEINIQLSLCETKLCKGPTTDEIFVTILYCESSQWEIPFVTLCNILSMNGELKLENLKNETIKCESVRLDRIQKFLLETLFKSSPPLFDVETNPTFNSERYVNAIHALYSSACLHDNPGSLKNPTPNINYYLKQFIDLFEAFSIQLYYIPDEDVPQQFEIIQVQSDTTLLNLIASWFQKPSDDIIINGKPLQQWTKLIGTVSFSHSSIEDFVKDYPENHLVAIYHEKKFFVVTKSNGELHHMDVESQLSGKLKIIWKRFNPGKPRISIVSRFDTIRLRSSIKRGDSFSGVAFIK